MLRILGAGLVVLSASFVGFGYARSVRIRQKQLSALIAALGCLRAETELRLTPLMDAFSQLEAVPEAAVSAFFSACSRQMREHPDRPVCSVISAALHQTPQLQLPAAGVQAMRTLGLSLGRFDLLGQSRAIELAAVQLERERQRMADGSDERARSYRAIGVCAGLAFVILLL